MFASSFRAGMATVRLVMHLRRDAAAGATAPAGPAPTTIKPPRPEGGGATSGLATWTSGAVRFMPPVLSAEHAGELSSGRLGNEVRGPGVRRIPSPIV